MDRNREARRAGMASSNGLSRRRHRSSSLRDSPDEDGAVELQETARLRDRGSKKDRDRERDRDRDRSSRSKRRRGDRLMHGSNREDGGEESTEESINDDEEEDDDDVGAVRMLPPNPASLPSSMSNHQHRKSYPPAKVVRAPPVWKAPDEMIGVSVPRKARSASTKRSHECWTSGGGGVSGEPIHRQASTSPVRPNAAASTAAVASPASISPSSSNVSIRKKMKPNGPKLRPPKSSSKPSSSQEDIEIEVAEALAVMRQSQGPSKQEIMANDSLKFESRDVNKSINEAKSRVSSPISNSTSAPQQSSSMLPQNSNSSAPHLSAVAPKRKRPRPRYEDEGSTIFGMRNSPVSSSAKVEIDQPAKIESSSSNLEKITGSANENGGVSYDLMNSQAAPELSEPQLESLKVGDPKPSAEEAESRDVVVTKEEPPSPKKESPLPRLDDDRLDATATKANSTISDVENQREEKFQIDLMAPPPQMRSSPERDGEINFVAADPKPMVSEEMKSMAKEGEKTVRIGKDEAVELEEKNPKSIVEEVESHKSIVNKERIIDLQLDFEKHDRDTDNGSASSSKLHQHAPKQQQQQQLQQRALKEEQNTEKTAQSSSLPLPMSVASWPGGLPPMGYMAPLQGVVSMDGSAVSSAAIQPPHFLFAQPRPKRCATHCYIAWSICQHQQLMRMNPFWPTAVGTSPLYGAKPCNLNVLPSVDLHGNFPGRNATPLADKGQGLAIFPGHSGKDKGSQAANSVDAAQRKQILLQQALPPGAPSNILHGPTFIFPLNQQQAAVAAATARPGSVKSPPTTNSAASSSASNSAPVSASTTAAAAAPVPGTATAMSFNYPNLPANDNTQYLAILQNNAYPFPIPAHVGTPPAYRGNHAQAVPFIHGSFYSSQMLHPSQLQQQQHQTTQQSQQIQHGHQNTTIPSGSSSSQKHLQNHPQQQQQQQQQRPHGSGISGANGNLQSFPGPKSRPAHPPVMQQHQQLQNAHIQLPHQPRQLEPEFGSEDSPSTADSRVSRGNQNVYGQNFAMPIPSNFALVAPPASLGGASGTGAGHGEKKQQQPQQHGLKAGVEPLPSQAFAMSFASINGAPAAPGLEISSVPPNHPIIHSLPDSARQHGYIIAAAAAQAAQPQKKSYRITEEGKSSIGDSSNVEEERKALAGKVATTVGQSIAFSRSDLPDASVTTIPGSGVIDSSARTLNLSSAPVRASTSVTPAAISTTNAPNSQQRQQQQMIQIQKQNQYAAAAAAAAAARSKTPASSNGSVYSDHLPTSSSMAAKFPNALSAFPQNLVQGSSSSGQSPQWKNSGRTTNSQVHSPTLSSSTAPSLKNLPQQQSRSQQNQIQISFAANPKSSTAPQGQQPPSSNQSPSPPMVVGSPTTSLSKSAGGSPRTTPTTSTGNKTGQASSLSSQQGKNSPSVPSRKSSPVGGRNVPSILGNPHITSSNNGPKPPMQQQQQQLPKQSLQQHAQLFFSGSFMQPQGPHSSSTTSASSATGGYYLPRRRSEQLPQQQPPQGSSATCSTGILTLCPPVTLGSASASDPAKAIAAAAAASNMKVGGLPSQGIIQAAQFAAAQSPGNPHPLMPANFPYVHTVPTAVQVKPAEQKQPAGNGGFLPRK